MEIIPTAPHQGTACATCCIRSPLLLLAFLNVTLPKAILRHWTMVFPAAIKEVTASIKLSPVLNRRNWVCSANSGQQAVQQHVRDLPPRCRTYCYQQEALIPGKVRYCYSSQYFRKSLGYLPLAF